MATGWKKTRHDRFWKLAKEQGWRSRASFKLIQLNKKYDILSECKAVLDLCAAPGGWLQVCQKFMPVSSLIVGVDLKPIKPMKGVVTLVNDITTQKCMTAIRKELQGWDMDVVLHDGAPDVGGSTWDKDAYTQVELVVHSLRLSTKFLRPGGTFVTKVFRNQDYNALLWMLKHFFKDVEATKPESSRNSSAEIFVVCRGYLAPKKIDPKLLDPEFLFKQVTDSKGKKDVFHEDGRKRHRSGYDDDANMTLTSKLSVSKFIDADTEQAIRMLGDHTSFVFDKASESYKQHEATDFEIKELCKDLKVLGKRDFSNLMKWRKKLRAYRDELLAEMKGLEDAEEDGGDEGESSEEELTEQQREELLDEKLRRDIMTIKQKEQQRKKNQKRRKREKRRKEIARMGGDLTGEGMAVETPAEQGMFSVTMLKNKEVMGALEQQGEAGDALEEDAFVSSGDEMSTDSELEQRSEASDSDEERVRRMESMLDSMYEQYKERQRIVVKKHREKLGLDAESSEEEGEGGSDHDRQDAEVEFDDGESNPLTVRLGEKHTTSAKARAKRFFSSDTFSVLDTDLSSKPKSLKEAGITGDLSDTDDDDDDAEDESSDSEMESTQNRKNKNKNKKKNKKNSSATKKTKSWTGVGSGSDNDEDDDGDDGEDSDEGVGLPAAGKMTKRAQEKARRKEIQDKRDAKNNKKKRKKSNKKGGDDDEGDNNAKKKRRMSTQEERKLEKLAAKDSGFEEVAADDWSDMSSDEDAIAERQAIGTLMLRKRARQQMIDDSYNRYAWGDLDDLPDWFADDETKNSCKQLPVTKEQVRAYRDKLNAIDARPMKKIAEAKARKKMKAVKRWEKLKQKAQAVSNSSDMSAGEKLQRIEKIYKKNKTKVSNLQAKRYVVHTKATKGKARGKSVSMNKDMSRGKGKAKTVSVDKRLRNDTRAMKRAEKKKASKGKKRGKKGRR